MEKTKLFDNNPLFKECVDALQIELLPEEQSDKISLAFKEMFPITTWGKIDWDKISLKVEIGYDPMDIIPAMSKLIQGNLDTNVYVEWSTMGIPVIKTDLVSIVHNFDDVACVSFEKFIFNPYVGYIIEVLSSYKITAGLVHVPDALLKKYDF